MNNKFKLPKIDILFQFIKFVRYLVLPIVIIFINTIKLLPWWGTLTILASIASLLLTLAYFGWRNFHYLFKEDRIVIYSGLFTKKEKTIYYQRIHSVNISQNIIHRLLKLANLTIETPGASIGGADGEIRCLSLDKARHLQSLLQHMGEASRNEANEQKEMLLQSIVNNMENSTSRHIVDEVVIDNAKVKADKQIAGNFSADDNGHKQHASIEEQTVVKVTLDNALMFKSAITSLNIHIVIAWFAGIFAFADDFINILFPKSTFIKDIFDNLDFSKYIIIFIIVAIISAVVMTWILSIVFYVVRFFDYRLERKGKQIHVSYGLLNRQSIVFNETKVQAIVFEENPIRQCFGYGELKVNIVKTTQQENSDTYTVIHPFIHKKDVADYVKQLMPKRELLLHEHEEKLPKKSMRTYLLIPTLFSLIPAVASAYWFHWSALWLVLLAVPVILWRFIQFRGAVFSIDELEIKLVSRSFSKHTLYAKRQSVVIMSEHASPYQRKHGLRKLSFNTLGGLRTKKYGLQGISKEQMERTQLWFSVKK